jgi:hypothetical protein
MWCLHGSSLVTASSQPVVVVTLLQLTSGILEYGVTGSRHILRPLR